VTHDEAVVASLADRVLILDRGRVASTAEIVR
jgi:ABC-type glutathione transport system ATPase component